MENFVLGPRQNINIPAPTGSSFEMLFPPCSTDYISNSALETSQGTTEGETHHQRASSDSFLIEQLSWLYELLDEPDSPLYKGHRRSSSDSVAFLDTATKTCRKDQETKLKTSACAAAGGPSWEFHTTNYLSNSLQTSFHSYSNPSSDKEKNKSKESPLISNTSISSSTGVLPASKDTITLQDSAPVVQSGVGLPSKSIVKQNQEVPVVSSNLNTNPSSSKSDSKRAKQQFAQRSRLRKLQYIAELERSVQISEAEGSQVSANLEYLNRQILILGMENQALRQRLDSLSQEQLAKYLEQDMLEKEIARLKFLYHQKQRHQQQHQWQRQQKQKHKQNGQQKYSTHNVSKTREVESQMTNLYI